MNEIACHRSGLSVHTRDDGKCVIVEWCDFHKQYQTAKERRHIESPQGGYYCGRGPWGIFAHPLSRRYAMRLFNKYVKAREEENTFWRMQETDTSTKGENK
ncbi:MAG: hypothetical protein JRJ79_07775 [Deltaproteobacteria bacterium]|nr:hypothetical protein [Deltaproteobacteria bacterium]